MNDNRDGVATVSRWHHVWMPGVLVALLLGACANESARAPNPTSYSWPDSFAFRVEHARETLRDTEVVAREEEAGRLLFAVRNDRYLVWHDGISRRASLAGAAPSGGRLETGDTLHYYVRLTRVGTFERIEPDCDPTVAECAATLPSALPMELRHVIARLPVWWPPKGHRWVDTLAFDDLPRPGAARGRVVTTYRDQRDTVVAGRPCWLVHWRARTDAERKVGGAMVPDPPVEEQGDVLVDKQVLMPVFAAWHGAPAARTAGATATAFRGRAWLVGSVFDSLQAAR